MVLDEVVIECVYIWRAYTLGMGVYPWGTCGGAVLLDMDQFEQE